MCVCVCVCVYIYLYLHLSMYLSIYLHTHARTHARAHTQHTHTHTTACVPTHREQEKAKVGQDLAGQGQASQPLLLFELRQPAKRKRRKNTWIITFVVHPCHRQAWMACLCFQHTRATWMRRMTSVHSPGSKQPNSTHHERTHTHTLTHTTCKTLNK